MTYSQDAAPDRIRKGLGDCPREIDGGYPPGRRSWRVIIQVDGRSDGSGEPVVDARIPSWNPHQVIRFPLSLVPEELRDQVVQDGHLIAIVNIGAERAEDLYLHSFEAAPEPATS